MAIFGFGARYEEDVTERFLSAGVACVGWRERDAPPAHDILRHVRTGDIVFIKSFTPQAGLLIKAVGIVIDGKVREIRKLGWGVRVRWTWRGEERIGKLDDKWPVRSVTIFQEHHPDVQRKIVELLLTHDG